MRNRGTVDSCESSVCHPIRCHVPCTFLTVFLIDTTDTGTVKGEGDTPIKAAKDFVHRFFTDDIPRQATALAGVSKWATAAFGLAPVCTAAVAWLQQAQDYSPRKKAEDNALKKQVIKTDTRAQELQYELAKTKGRWQSAAEKVKALQSEVSASKKQCLGAEQDAAKHKA